jgi:hypothetical protein
MLESFVRRSFSSPNGVESLMWVDVDTTDVSYARLQRRRRRVPCFRPEKTQSEETLANTITSFTHWRRCRLINLRQKLTRPNRVNCVVYWTDFCCYTFVRLEDCHIDIINIFGGNSIKYAVEHIFFIIVTEINAIGKYPMCNFKSCQIKLTLFHICNYSS